MRSRCAVPLMLTVLAVLCSAAEAEMVVSLDDTNITVTADAAGSTFAIVGINRFVSGVAPVTARVATVTTDEDGDGVLTWTPGYPIGEESFWAAVDTTAGGVSLVWPSELELVELPLDLTVQLVPGPGGAASRLEIPLTSFALFLIRPSAGIWELGAEDGGAADLDAGWDEAIAADLSLATATDGSGTAFGSALPGDVIIGCSLADATYFAAAVGS